MAIERIHPAVVAPSVTDRARRYASASRSPRTWRAYRSDMRHYTEWCLENGHCPLPAVPETVAAYLVAFAGVLSCATLQRRLTAISVAHQTSGHETPTRSTLVRTIHAGIRREHGAPPRKAAAARTDAITAMLGTLGDRLIDHRDRALILIGYTGALRRSELVGLDVADITEDYAGLRLRIARSKTDQDGQGATVGVPRGSTPGTCPVHAWRTWVEESGITSGPAFRAVTKGGEVRRERMAGRAVARIIQRRADAAGLVGDWSGHSLRAGFATEGYARGTRELRIMRHGRWKSVAAMRGYVEQGGLWVDNAAADLGL